MIRVGRELHAISQAMRGQVGRHLGHMRRWTIGMEERSLVAERVRRAGARERWTR